MTQNEFNVVLEQQYRKCADVLVHKKKEYTGDRIDRLSAFKIAASLQGCTPKTALAGMMSKHVVSLYDMLRPLFPPSPFPLFQVSSFPGKELFVRRASSLLFSSSSSLSRGGSGRVLSSPFSIMITFGRKLKHLRQKNHLTQKELGIALGFPEDSADVRIAQYEADARKPRDEILAKMAKILYVPIDVLTVPVLSEPREYDAASFWMHELSAEL